MFIKLNHLVCFMKKLVLSILFFLLLPLVFALPYADHIVDLTMNTSIELSPDSPYAKIQELDSEIYAFPKNGEDQLILELKQNPNLLTNKIKHDKLIYNWRDNTNVTYGYSSVVDRKIKPVKITSKEPYPFDFSILLPEVKKYLRPSEHIDSDYPKIKELAKNLAREETDLWSLVVKTALWVRRQVPYDLNTMTANAAQKASWVLENKKGVCDEITALFMALLRANNIPVRFIYGISYTNSPLVNSQWGPHGWAEVYFPNYGWVPFDLTFDQYGWLDAGHVKLFESEDPKINALQVTWRGKDYKLKLGNLNYNAHIRQNGETYTSNVEFKPTIHSSEVSLDSMNLVIVEVKNKNNYYVATNLKIGEVKELEVIGSNENFLTLAPGEEKQVYYTIKLKEGLKEQFTYQIPIVIFNEKNETSQIQFIASKAGTKLTQSDVNIARSILEEERIKPFSSIINLNCTAPPVLEQYEKAEVTCSITSDGSFYFENAGVCLFQSCKEVSFSTNAQVKFPLTMKTGKQDLRITFRHDQASKSQVLTLERKDTPELELENINYPSKISEGREFKINFTVTQKSYTPPKNISVKIFLPRKTQLLKIESFNKALPIEISVSPRELYGGKNKVSIILEYDDTSTKEDLTIEKQGGGAFWEVIYGIREFFTSILDAFSALLFE